MRGLVQLVNEAWDLIEKVEEGVDPTHNAQALGQIMEVLHNEPLTPSLRQEVVMLDTFAGCRTTSVHT